MLRAKGEPDGVITATLPVELSLRFITEVMREGMRMAEQDGCSRLSVRAVVPAGALSILQSSMDGIMGPGPSVEARVPLGFDHVMVYMGYNSPERSAYGMHAKSSRSRWSSLLPIIPVPGPALNGMRPMTYDGYVYDIRVVDGAGSRLSAEDSRGVVALMEAFGHDGQAALRTASSGMGTLCIAYGYDGSMLGVSLAERSLMQLPGGGYANVARLVEGVVSEHATALYPQLLGEMLRYMHGNHNETRLLYSEADASSAQMMGIAAQQGRAFGGILPAHRTVSGNGAGTSQPRDMAVTYMTMNQVGKLIEAGMPGTALRVAARA